MKKVILLILTVALASLFYAHVKKPKQIENGGPEISYQYLSEKDYLVVEYVESVSEMFDSERIRYYDVMLLTLMTGKYEKFLDTEIVIDSYYVTNHPLDDDFDRFRKSIYSGFKRYYPNKTRVFVGRYGNQIIGGFSMDHFIGENVVANRIRDVDGRLLKDVVGESFPEWKDHVIELLNRSDE